MSVSNRVAMGCQAWLHRASIRLFSLRLLVARRSLRRWQIMEEPDPEFSGITLITVAFNNPPVVDAQIQLLTRWLSDSFRHVVVDNSPDRIARRRIRMICEANGVEYVRAPQNPYTGRDPSFSHAEALNYTVRHLPGIQAGAVVGFLDHDIFPTQPVSILEVMKSHRAYGRRQTMGNEWYLWPGLAFIRCDSADIARLDFSPDRGRGDTGAGLASMLAKWSPNEIAFTQERRATIPLPAGDHYIYEMHDGWAHATSASGWRGSNDPRVDAAVVLARALLEAALPEI